MVFSLLANVDVILGFAILILTIFYRFEFPPVLGFLVTGMLIGPYGLEILSAGQNVDLNSELGIIFLLFTIGVDLSLKELWKIKKACNARGYSPDSLDYSDSPRCLLIPWLQSRYICFYRLLDFT